MTRNGSIARMVSSPDWLRRYREGQRDQVWAELRELGGAVRRPGLAPEAQLVCDEMARRGRHNVEVIVARLASQGYRFHSNDFAQTPVMPWVPPSARAAQHAAWLQERFGPVPMTVLSWVRIVGDIWLVGTHPQWPESASGDPLVIELEGSRYPGESIADEYEHKFRFWREWAEQDPGAGPFTLDIAPDRLHKDNISGGPPYGIIVPDPCADAQVTGEEGDDPVPFVSYLNDAFAHGGFPYGESPRLPGAGSSEVQVKRSLNQDLLPL
jgi:hypothetical protein